MESQALAVQEVLFTPTPELAKPIVIVSQTVVEHVSNLLRHVDDLEVAGMLTMQEAAKLLNDMGKAASIIKNRSLEFGRPFRDESDRIRQETDLILKPLLNGQAILNKKMAEYQAKQRAEAELARKEAERLREEAAKREAESKKALEKAKTEAQFEKAAQQFDKGLEVAAIAAEAAIIVPEVVKPKGVREIQIPVIDSYDLKLLPVGYHLLDEKKVKAHILDGTLDANTPGLKFHIETKFSGTGR